MTPLARKKTRGMHLLIATALALSRTASVPTIEALEAEHQRLLAAPDAENWTPPVFDANHVMFSWRVAGTGISRNVTQVAAVLTLTTAGRPPIVCHPAIPKDLHALCGSASEWHPGKRYNVTLDVVLRVGLTATTNVTAVGQLLRGPRWDESGAEWIGVLDPNSTASQFRATTNIRSLSFLMSGDVAEATLFVAGLGGFRPTVNGRALDPTSVRGSVTEWSNRTFYFADDVTSDLRRAAAASSDGLVTIAVELYKHWYFPLARASHVRLPVPPRTRLRGPPLLI